MSLYQAEVVPRDLWLLFRQQAYPADIERVQSDGDKITVWETSTRSFGVILSPSSQSCAQAIVRGKPSLPVWSVRMQCRT